MSAGDPAGSGSPPEPDGIGTVDEFVMRLRALRGWVGISEREVHRRVVRARTARGVPEIPSYDTVHRCFQLGRSRLNGNLAVDIAAVLLGDDTSAARWRAALARLTGQTTDTAAVVASESLPDDLAVFTGRQQELDRVRAWMAAATGSHVLVIEGMAGVGKTALAVHIAHSLLRERAADMVLSVNLHAYSPGTAPAAPVAVLGAFLRALGMSPDRLRLLNLPARAREFRERLAGKRVLLLLDNAVTEDQVRPLLPGGAASTVLITSRNSLPELAADMRAHLDVFSAEEALHFLCGTVGADVIRTHEDTAARIADVVGHLPLAMTVVAARIKNGAGWTLADHLERLVSRRSRLKFDAEIEQALRLSYDGLGPPCQRLFRLLALHPGPAVDSYAAAALAGIDQDSAEQRLRTLLSANLLTRQAGAYKFHDLVKDYATSQSDEHDAAHARHAAITRLLDHYRHAAAQAMDHFAPHERRHRPSIDPPATPLPDFDDRCSATTWLHCERPNLVAAATYAADHGWPEHVGHLSAILFRFLDLSGYYDDAETLHARASRAGPPEGRGWALASLGITQWRLGRYAAAIGSLRQAHTAFDMAGDLAGQGWALGNLGVAYQRLGQLHKADSSIRASLTIARRIGDTVGQQGRGIMFEPLDPLPENIEDQKQLSAIAQEILGVARRMTDHFSAANALEVLGLISRRLGRPQDADDYERQALTIAREQGNLLAESRLLNELGATRRDLNQPRRALRDHREALALARALGDRRQQAVAYEGIAHCALAMGNENAAHLNRQHAQAIFTELGAPEARTITAQ